MAKKAELSQAGETLQFKSLSDFAFAHAGLTGKVQEMAKYAIANIAGFPAECPDESKAELKTGYIDMKDIRTTFDAADKAQQNFWFIQSMIAFGGIFKI